MHRTLFIVLALGMASRPACAFDRKAFEAYCAYVGHTYAYAAALRNAGLSQAQVSRLVPPVRTPFTQGTTARMHRDDIRKLFERPRITPELAGTYWREGCLERESPP